jgi:hypothetical protein
MKRPLILAVYLAAIPFPMVGCGTLMNTCYFTRDEGGNKVYGGVRVDWEVATHPENRSEPFCLLYNP